MCIIYYVCIIYKSLCRSLSFIVTIRANGFLQFYYSIVVSGIRLGGGRMRIFRHAFVRIRVYFCVCFQDPRYYYNDNKTIIKITHVNRFISDCRTARLRIVLSGEHYNKTLYRAQDVILRQVQFYRYSDKWSPFEEKMETDFNFNFLLKYSKTF